MRNRHSIYEPEDASQISNRMFLLWALEADLQTRDAFLDLVSGGRPFNRGRREITDQLVGLWKCLPRSRQDLFFRFAVADLDKAA